jgi:RimJ/RimL family protein N-acetyltransferase
MTVAPLRAEDRGELRSLLDSRRAADAQAAYYALHHPAARVRMWVYANGGRREGFLVRAQTGRDLFRPLVILRAPHAGAAELLLRAALPTGSAFLVLLTEQSADWPLPLRLDEPPIRSRLLELNAARFEPIVNIFVVRSPSPDGLPRFEIRQGERLLAAAGVNWQSPEWAEVFVQTEPEVQNRGYGKSVVAALCRELLEGRRRVLYAVEESNNASRHLAEGLGFADTGEREQMCAASLVEHRLSDSHLEKFA